MEVDVNEDKNDYKLITLKTSWFMVIKIISIHLAAVK